MMTKMKILLMFLMGSLSLARGDDDQCVATYRKMDLCAKTLLVFPKNTEFMGKTRARGKVFLANGDGEMLELNEELEKMELEQAELLAENVALKAEMLELQTIYSGIQGKHDLYFAPPSPPPPSPSPPSPPSPPPPRPPAPPPKPLVSPIPQNIWTSSITACLNEQRETGECTIWASGNAYGTMPNWDTSLITNMGLSFASKTYFDGDISRWDTSSVQQMNGMFQYARDFNQDIGNWDVSNVVRMDDMFWATNTFNRDIGRWNVARVTNMQWMFEDGIAFDQDISGWRGPAAESAQGNMFQGATAFQARFTCTNAVTGPASSCRLK